VSASAVKGWYKMITKTRSLVVSETVFNLAMLNEDFTSECVGSLETFNNCRETGLMLNVWEVGDVYLPVQKSICVWVHECRNSDSIVVRWGFSEDKDVNNMFSENVHKNQSVSYRVGDYKSAVDCVLDVVRTLSREIFAEAEQN
jgi:hypothetical protein